MKPRAGRPLIVHRLDSHGQPVTDYVFTGADWPIVLPGGPAPRETSIAPESPAIEPRAERIARERRYRSGRAELLALVRVSERSGGLRALRRKLKNTETQEALHLLIELASEADKIRGFNSGLTVYQRMPAPIRRIVDGIFATRDASRGAGAW